MPFSRLSNCISKNAPGAKTVKAVTWLIRELTGIVFIFSGFVKAIDPWGTLYKVEEYLSVMGISVWPNLVTVGVFALCSVEFVVGVMLCFGCFRRTAAWGTLAIMAVMLPLTLWIAVADPVADCGCFGDAFIISNWATFWKNVALAAAAAWLAVYNRRAGCVITPALQWIALVATAGFILLIALFGYVYQPLIDFRQYKTGTPLTDNSASEDSQPEFRFIYEKDGVKKEFSADDELPSEDDGWTFVDRIAVNDPGSEARVSVRSEKNFRLWDKGGEEDVTDEIFTGEGKKLLLLMPDLKDVSIATTWKINSLNDWADKHDIEMIAAVTGTESDIANWEDLSMPEYGLYTADDTAIKELARGNPAVVYTRNDTIIWKSSLRAIDTDDFMLPGTSADPMSFGRDDRRTLRNITSIYVAVMAFLACLSFMPRLSLFRKDHS